MNFINIVDNFCSFSNVPEGSVTVSGQVPGGCNHVMCNNNEGYNLSADRDVFRMCMYDGKWSELSSQSTCVLE